MCGTSHQRRSLPCQDAWCWKRASDDILLAAVADGAGSVTRSDVGAKVAVEAAIDFLATIDFTRFSPPQSVDLADTELAIAPEMSDTEEFAETSTDASRDNSENDSKLDSLADSTGDSKPKPSEESGDSSEPSATPSPLETVLRETLAAAREAVEAEAERQAIAVGEYASTAIAIVATSEWVAVAQIGDGATVVRDIDGSAIALTQPQQGEYANQTTFLTSDDALDTAQTRIWHGRATHLALFSDGLQRLALQMPEGTPFDRFFNPLFQFVAQDLDETEGNRQLAAFLQSPRVTQRTDDDLTLLLGHLAERIERSGE